MTVLSRGLLLGRRASGTFDERLSFLTDTHGRLTVTAFGTRSLKSRRRALLARPHWLNLGLEPQKRGHTLAHLSLWHENPHVMEGGGTEDFLGALALCKRLPPRQPQETLALFHRIYSVKPRTVPPWLLRLRAAYGLLAEDGRGPHFAPEEWPRGAGFDRPTGAFLPADLVAPRHRLSNRAMAMFTAWGERGLPDARGLRLDLAPYLDLAEAEGRSLIEMLETLWALPAV